jgi:predicted DNA repair protein MutK
VGNDRAWRIVLVAAGLALVLAAIEYGPSAWAWLTEDLGTRLRRECESVVREALRDRQVGEYGRKAMVTECIFERGKKANH